MKLFYRIAASLLLLLTASSFLLPVSVAHAATPLKCPNTSDWTYLKPIGEEEDTRVCCPKGSETNARDCFFAKYLNPTIKVLSAVAGVAVIIGIILGGMQYAASAGDPQKSAAGKGKIMKSLYALFTFLFLFGLLQFLSPGGLNPNSKPMGVSPPGVAKKCSKTFMGIQPWYRYLPDEAFKSSSGGYTCEIENFAVFGESGKGDKSYVLNVALAVVDGLLRVVALVAVAFVIVGGAKYILSQGSPDGTKQAKDSILNALIGLVIAIVATAVVSFIGNRLT